MGRPVRAQVGDRSRSPWVRWIYTSPAQLIEPGERVGVFRIGSDELLTGADGSSLITIRDYAAGIVGQLENPAAHRQQIILAC